MTSTEARMSKGYAGLIGCHEADLIHLLFELTDWDRIKEIGKARFGKPSHDNVLKEAVAAP